MNYFLILGLFLFFYMTSWFLIALIKKRNDIADVAWGLGFVFIAWLSFLFFAKTGFRNFIVVTMVSVWGIRLAYHINARHIGRPEDSRYLNWRNQWEKWFYVRSYLQIFLLQGLFLFLVSLPILVINRNSSSGFNFLDLIGITVWIIGFIFESVGDAQLAKFIKNPINKGKLMETGLWRYSRHPNYFGEVTQWWGIWLIALNVNNGFISIIGPITITILILFVSGIPMFEKKYAGREDFEDYKKRTSIFIPLPPKKLS